LLAAGLAAAVGLVANAVSDRRRRLADVAVLRALGTKPSTLRTMILLEAVVVLGVATGLGVGIAVLLSWLLLPSLTVNVEGAIAVPPPSLVVPWTQLTVLLLVTAVATIATPIVVSRSLRRVDVASILRLGEGRR